MTELTHEELLFVVNELIETSVDGRQGFLDAEQAAQNARLKRLCGELVMQRSEFVAELQDEARRLGGDPDSEGSVTGALHRRWIAVKAAIAGHDDEAIAAECERGEDIAVTRYREALEKQLPAPLREIVTSQARKLEEARERLRALRRE